MAGAPVPAAPPASIGILPEQITAIAAARQRARRISRAASVAALSGWTLAVFAAVSVVFGIFDLSSLVLGIGLAITAYVELRGSKALRRFDRNAPKWLAINQLALGLMLVSYGTWGIYSAIYAPSPYDSYIAQGGQVGDMLKGIAHTTMTITIITYSVVICVSAIAQSCMSWYYLSRHRHMRAYLASTEPWIIDTLRAAA